MSDHDLDVFRLEEAAHVIERWGLGPRRPPDGLWSRVVAKVLRTAAQHIREQS